MTKARPPRKPAGEDLAITVANQDIQIKVLIEACEGHRKERDELGRKVSFQMAEIARLEHALSIEKGLTHHLQSVHERMEGWQDCAREVIGLARMIIAPGV